MKVLAKQSFYGIDVLLVCKMVDGKIVDVIDSFTAKRIESGSMIEARPTFTGHTGLAFLQSALQAAWDQGLRPEGFKDNTAANDARFAAVDNHLQDMRALVFRKPVTIPNFLKPEGQGQ